MGYSEDESMVRVDFFKASGKWYTTEAIKWTGSWKGNIKEGGQLIKEAFAQSIRDYLDRPDRFREMDAVCLEPYHEHAHPIILKQGSWREK